jgi:L-threonylcarbamoyladenylate synthase
VEILAASHEGTLAAGMAQLDAGHLVIVPGDLRYFLVGDALDDSVAEAIFEATQRGADRPLTVLVSGSSDIHHVAYEGPLVRQITDAHWPGPLVLSLKSRPWLPEVVNSGGRTVRVNAPANAFTNALARQFGPLAAASARSQGQPDSLDAATSCARLGASARLCVDGGTLPGGQESHLTPAQQG